MSARVPVVPDNASLAALVFELASQLHVERARRLALELALQRAGVLVPGATTDLAADAEWRRLSTQASEESMARLMRVIADAKED